MTAWPALLPPPAIDGYGVNPDDATQRTAFEGGTARSRRRYSTTPSRIPVKWRFNGSQLAAFETWHKHTVLDGSAWFSIDLANGLGIQSMEARFTGQPKKALLPGMYWDVQSELEVRSPPIMTQTYLDAALAYPPNDLSQVSSALHTLITTTLPSANYW